MKIAFYLDNMKSIKINFSKPYMGNPGVGGTQYMISTISWYYAKKFVNNEVLIYAPNIENLPDETMNLQAESLLDAYAMSERSKVDIFVCRSTSDVSFFEKVNKGKTKVILWGHNFATFKELNLIAKSKMVVQYICVSKEQFKLIQGHKSFNKSTYIYNGIFTDIFPENDSKRDKETICYLGSIVPTKGFDVTARLWRYLYNDGFKLKLHIIGSGQLYNKNAKLGKYGIAQEEFEAKFIKYLTDDKGNLLEEIIFHGVLNHEEKIAIMSNAVVGIVNPTGETETFGISAIEFQLLNIPVVTFNKGGLKNTVLDGQTGYLVNSFEELVKTTKKLVELYSENVEEYLTIAKNARSFVLKNFDINSIIDEWNNLFVKVVNGDLVEQKVLDINLIKRLKNIINLILYKQ